MADGKWRQAGFGILIGLAVGLPLAILNVFALQFTQGQAIAWQDPLAAILDALQPGIFEEVIYLVLLTGSYDLLIEVVCRDRSHLLDFLTNKLHSVEGVKEAALEVGPLGEVCDPTDPADIARAIHLCISALAAGFSAAIVSP